MMIANRTPDIHKKPNDMAISESVFVVAGQGGGRLMPTPVNLHPVILSRLNIVTNFYSVTPGKTFTVNNS